MTNVAHWLAVADQETPPVFGGGMARQLRQVGNAGRLEGLVDRGKRWSGVYGGYQENRRTAKKLY
jgi:hypothetical protein